jgi:putative salt-induced outer membrane protein YdiY
MYMDFSIPKILLLFACLLPIKAISDEVFLKNGDHISGNIINKTGEILVLNTSYAGEIEIQWSDVSHLVTEKPVHIILDDETDLKGILSVIDGTEQRIGIDSDTEQQSIPMQRIAAINPPEKPKFTFSGQINSMVDIDRGNTDEDDYHLDFDTVLRWPTNRLTFSFDGDLDKQEDITTDQEANLFSAFDHFLTEKWYSTSGIFLEHDKFSDLGLRTTIFSGLGYDIVESKRTNISIAAAPGYVWEDFRDSDDQDFRAAIWRLSFDHYLFKTLKLQTFHNHSYRQSLEEGSDYIFKSKTGLRIPLIENLQISLQYNFDWDNAPADDADKDDRETLITAGYKW